MPEILSSNSDSWKFIELMVAIYKRNRERDQCLQTISIHLLFNASMLETLVYFQAKSNNGECQEKPTELALGKLYDFVDWRENRYKQQFDEFLLPIDCGPLHNSIRHRTSHDSIFVFINFILMFFFQFSLWKQYISSIYVLHLRID